MPDNDVATIDRTDPEAHQQPDPFGTVEAFPHRRAFDTRWNDNDVFGHVNNTIYYAAMDTAITSWFVSEYHLDPTGSEWIAVIVASSCRFVKSAVFPDVIEVGVRAERIGRSSIVWRFGLFRQSDGALLATGEFVHVVVARDGDRRPVPVPDDLRALVERTMLRPEADAPSAHRASSPNPS
ncbi:acyl-CoA thioesterase [Curtobacterium sp. Leaf261]|uniref:acyl-CoA thioesterase n=1 Tax=Curtobacterium sp. Leaf261 TaxID=1736311 RepID=UPI0009E94660|nr:thioesterase family protein [Curtobacterium sp. Leaf261]